MITTMRNLTALAAAGLLAVSAHAQAGSHFDDMGNNSTRMGWYVDFASTTLSDHYSEPTFAFPGNSGAVKYHALQLNSFAGNAAVCFDISTAHPDLLPGVTADTRIWYQNGSTYSVLNDDANGTLFSHGMVYLSGANAFMNLYVAAYNTTWNSAQFKIYALRENLTETQCTTGNGGIPWVKYKNGVITNG